jgi:hypothetical protein
MTPKPVRGRSLFRKYNMVKAINSAKAGGLEIGGVEVAPDGTIRVLSKDATGQISGDAFEDWKRGKGDAHSA